MPKISIIVPVYNVEKYIHECVTSLLEQTLKDIEIILVDDASPDKCPEICNNYARQDKRIKVIHKKNGGLGDARNAGLKMVLGEYVIMLDSDDMLKPSSALEELYSIAKRDGLDACYFYFTRFNEVQEKLCDEGWQKYTVMDSHDAILKFCLNMVGAEPSYPKDACGEYSACKVMYSTKIIKENKLKFVSERQYASEDIFWNVDFLNHSRKIALLPKGFYYYRYNENSISHTSNLQKVMAIDNSARYMECHLKQYFGQEQMNLHYKRFLLRTLRLSVSNTVLSAIPFKKKYKKINSALRMQQYQPLFKTYPYWDLPLIPKAYYILAKMRMSLLLYLCVRLLKK